MKKTVVFCILLAFLVNLISLPAAAKSQPSTIRGTFRYVPAAGNPYEESVFYYSDDYFAESGKQKNLPLLSLSMALAMSTFESRGANYVTQMLQDMGFCDIVVADLIEKPTKDTIGTAIAHKQIGEHQLIAVAIRGKEYGAEWASNFTIGASGNVQGMDDACAKVLNRLQAYLETYRLTNCKIWMAGYSRAGAITNLAGVYLNQHRSDFSVTEDDLYLYAFEPPAASADDTVYQNIHIVINPNDLFFYLYPESWGFHTNGEIIKICEPQRMKTYTGLLFPQEAGEVDIPAFLAELLSWLSGRLSREEYATMLEEPIVALIEAIFGDPDHPGIRIEAFLTEDYIPYVWESTENQAQLTTLLLSALSRNSDYIYREIADLLSKFLDERKDALLAKGATDADLETMKASLYPLLRVFGPVIVDDMHYYSGVDYDWYYERFLPKYNMADADLGKLNGSSTGERNGYAAGLNQAAFDPSTTVRQNYGPEYEEAYRAAYLEAYETAFELGKSHAENPALKGAYDGEKAGSENGFFDGKNGREPIPVNKQIQTGDRLTEEYIAAYNAAYERQYTESYEAGRKDTEIEPEEPKVIDSYHILSLVKNVSEIVQYHYPEINFTYVQAMDPHDTEAPSDAKSESLKNRIPTILILSGIGALTVLTGGAVALLLIPRKRKRTNQ